MRIVRAARLEGAANGGGRIGGEPRPGGVLSGNASGRRLAEGDKHASGFIFGSRFQSRARQRSFRQSSAAKSTVCRPLVKSLKEPVAELPMNWLRAAAQRASRAAAPRSCRGAGRAARRRRAVAEPPSCSWRITRHATVVAHSSPEDQACLGSIGPIGCIGNFFRFPPGPKGPGEAGIRFRAPPPGRRRGRATERGDEACALPYFGHDIAGQAR